MDISFVMQRNFKGDRRTGPNSRRQFNVGDFPRVFWNATLQITSLKFWKTSSKLPNWVAMFLHRKVQKALPLLVTIHPSLNLSILSLNKPVLLAIKCHRSMLSTTLIRNLPKIVGSSVVKWMSLQQPPTNQQKVTETDTRTNLCEYWKIRKIVQAWDLLPCLLSINKMKIFNRNLRFGCTKNNVQWTQWLKMDTHAAFARETLKLSSWIRITNEKATVWIPTSQFVIIMLF